MPQTRAVIPNVQPQATIPTSPSSEALFIGMWDPLATLPLIQTSIQFDKWKLQLFVSAVLV